MPDYDSFRSSLKTGDIVIFSGKGAISDIIKLFSGGKWSHVGMLLRIESFGDALLLWESTTLNNIKDIESDSSTQGVQLVPFSQRIASYSGEIIIRQLNNPITTEMFNKLAECRQALSRKPYEKSKWELLRSAYDGVFGKSPGEDLSSLFCSELVAEAYQAMGLLPEYPAGLPSNEYTPMDFSTSGRGGGVKLLNGYELGQEISIIS